MIRKNDPLAKQRKKLPERKERLHLLEKKGSGNRQFEPSRIRGEKRKSSQSCHEKRKMSKTRSRL